MTAVWTQPAPRPLTVIRDPLNGATSTTDTKRKGGLTVPEQEDLRTSMARIEGMLQATLPHHAARLDEYGRAITGLAATQVEQSNELSAIKAVALAATRTPAWVPVVASLAGVAGAIVAIVLALTHHA